MQRINNGLAGGTALALLALSGILPDGWIAFALSFWAVLIWPGWLLAGLLFRLPVVRRIPLAFLLSIGMLSIPAVILVRLETDLVVLTRIVGLLIVGLAAAQAFFGGKTAAASDERPDWKVLLPALLVGAGLIGLWAYRAPISDEGDHWFYLMFIRHYLDLGFATDLNPLAGQAASAGTLLRANLNVWWPLQAVVYRASGLPLMAAYWHGLPPVLMALSFFSLYGLGVQVFRKTGVALTAVLFQGLYLASSIGSHSWAGNGFFLDIAEDKYVVAFILLPAALSAWLQVVDGPRPGRLLALAFCFPALALTHPMGALQFGAAVGGWLLARLTVRVLERQAGKWLIALGLLVMLLLLPMAAGARFSLPFDAGRSQEIPFYSQTINLDGERFLANPHVIAHPLVLLAIGLSLFCLPRIRDREAGFLLGATWLPLLLAFHPFYAALLGRVSGIWLVWRIVWVLPVALIAAASFDRLRIAVESRSGRLISGWMPFFAMLVLGFLVRNYLFDSAGLLRDQKYRTVLPDEIALLEAVGLASGPGDVVLAPFMINTHLPAFNPRAKLLNSRGMEARDGLSEKVLRFYSDEPVDGSAVDLLREWEVRFVVLPNGSGPDYVWRASPEYFTRLYENRRYVLYEVDVLPDPAAWSPAPAPPAPADDLHPNPAENDLAAGNRFLVMGRLDDALAAYERVIAFNPEIFRLAGARGYWSAFGRSLIFDRRADRISEAFLGIGGIYERLGQPEQAAETYARLIELLPDREAGYAAMERALSADGRTTEFIPMYEQAARIFFWLNWPTIRLADFHLAAGRDAEAAALLKEVLHRTPRDVFTLVRLARLFRVARSLDLALEYGLRALESANRVHELAQANYELGQIYWARGDLDQALVHFLVPAELLPEHPVHHATIGDFYRMALNDPAGALPFYETAVSLDPGNASYLLTLGDLYRALDRPALAQEVYSAAATIDPNLPGLQERLNQLP